jgi:hypothetical protein
MWMQQGLQACVWRGRVWESLGKCYLTTCRAVILPRFGGPEVRYINPFLQSHIHSRFMQMEAAMLNDGYGARRI